MNSLNGVMVVGLTGQTGAGKSTVSKIFASNGFAVIDADQVARKIVEKGTKCLDEIADFFGSQVINEDGTLNRKALAGIVFSDKSKLEMLNTISYPYITGEILRQIRVHSMKGEKLILLDAPTLFESRADDFCEIIISVLADADIREKRIISRDGLTADQARKRMNSQLNEEFFRSHSDYIIHNNGNLDTVNGISWEVSGKIRELFKSKQAPVQYSNSADMAVL
ncbi:dephospho-CoA kinase [Ruminococcus sp.]|uniref:dephospho-CoA kinase n=1 Tax=Ruminococcus sp. TaxID=41978 RepID=UPI002CF91EEA|nr:dephospho-CoA kinase [Ruminococcus sp.]HNZ98205.1 dephospho-CoA kinase [Ruminococcus sp.]HOH87131.1 dephospho-CoA kinase [Ruminococcus sp.]